MPSVIVLLKSYTPAVLPLSLPLPNFSAVCILPRGRAWEAAEWAVQSGWVVLERLEVTGIGDRGPAIKIETSGPRAAQRKCGNTNERYRGALFQISRCPIGMERIQFFFRKYNHYTLRKCSCFPKRDTQTGWQQKHDCGKCWFLFFFSQHKVSCCRVCEKCKWFKRRHARPCSSNVSRVDSQELFRHRGKQIKRGLINQVIKMVMTLCWCPEGN